MILRFIALVIKELQEQMSTARGVAVLIVPVLLQTLIFPFVATQDVTKCSVAVYNEDSGPAAVELLQRIAAAPYIADMEMLYGESVLAEHLDAQKSMVGVHIPPHFSAMVARGEASPLQVICDGRRSNSSQIAGGYVSSIVMEWLQERHPGRLEPVVRHMYNPNLSYKWYILTCLFGMLGMITSMNISCMALAKEREAGTFEQLCVTPLATAELLLGKMVPATLILLVQCVVIFLVATLGYGLPVHGSVWALFFAMAVYSLALAGIGFSISAICQTQQQAFIGMFCFVLPAVLLSGFLAPVENMPAVLQYVAHANPLYYIFIVARGVFLKGYGMPEVLSYIGIFVLISMGTMSLACVVLRLRRA